MSTEVTVKRVDGDYHSSRKAKRPDGCRIGLRQSTLPQGPSRRSLRCCPGDDWLAGALVETEQRGQFVPSSFQCHADSMSAGHLISIVTQF